jgi:type II secretory pathway pseudopilin PulG
VLAHKRQPLLASISEIIDMNQVSTFHTTRVKKSQRGATSIELGLVLLIIVSLIVAAVWGFRENKRRTSVNENTQQLLHISSNMITKYGRPGRYADVDTAVAVRGGVIPANLRDGTDDTATNTFGGAITVATNTLTGANDSVLLTWPAVVSNQCSDIVSNVAGEFRQIEIDGAEVKPDNGPLDIVALEEACDAGTETVELNLVIGRF